MKKRIIAILLLASLFLASCVMDEPAVHEPSNMPSASESVAESDVQTQNLLHFDRENPPFASYTDYTAFIAQADGNAMVIDTNYNAETGACDWQYASADKAELEQSLAGHQSMELSVDLASVKYWIVFPSGIIYGCYFEASEFTDSFFPQLLGVKCRINDDPDEPYVGMTSVTFSSSLYLHLLYCLDKTDSMIDDVKTENLFDPPTKQPPFELSMFYESLQKRADGRAIVCSYKTTQNSTKAWTYQFVEMQNGAQSLKDNEDNIIEQSSPHMNHVYFDNFIIFPDGTIYGVYPPSISERVADVCDARTDLDYGAIFTVDASGYFISYERTDCFLPDGAFDLLEQTLGEIETEDNRYLFEIEQEYLVNNSTGLPFDSVEDLRHIIEGVDFACLERVIDEDGMRWETVYRQAGQDPIWQIDELFTPTDKNYYGDGYELFLIDKHAAVYDKSDGSLLSVRMYAMFAQTLSDEAIDGYESCAGKPYGAIYTFDMTAKELSYTVQYGYFEKSVASYIDIID